MTELPAPWPARVPPMLATAAPLPIAPAGFGFEWKWDGWRCGVRRLPDGAVRLDSRNGQDLTTTFPEITEAPATVLPGRQVVFDGEIVALSPDTGAPDFTRLQQRLGVRPTPERIAAAPATYVVFDLLRLDDTPVADLPYATRQDMLGKLALFSDRVLVPPHQTDIDPAELMAIAAEHHLEGVVSKRLDTPYRPGRSRAWLKHPLRARIETVIGGWLPSDAGHGQHLGSILVGFPVSAPGGGVRLEFAGGVGTGWTVALGRRLHNRLLQLAADSSPFTTTLPHPYRTRARWTTPALVADIEYRNLTTDGLLRHPAYKGLRPDRDLRELMAPDR